VAPGHCSKVPAGGMGDPRDPATPLGSHTRDGGYARDRPHPMTLRRRSGALHIPERCRRYPGEQWRSLIMRGQVRRCHPAIRPSRPARPQFPLPGIGSPDRRPVSSRTGLHPHQGRALAGAHPSGPGDQTHDRCRCRNHGRRVVECGREPARKGGLQPANEKSNVCGSRSAPTGTARRGRGKVRKDLCVRVRRRCQTRSHRAASRLSRGVDARSAPRAPRLGGDEALASPVAAAAGWPPPERDGPDPQRSGHTLAASPALRDGRSPDRTCWPSLDGPRAASAGSASDDRFTFRARAASAAKWARQTPRCPARRRQVGAERHAFPGGVRDLQGRFGLGGHRLGVGACPRRGLWLIG